MSATDPTSPASMHSGTGPALAERVPLVSVEGLRVHFTSKRGVVHAVDGVTLDIGDGETVALVGETGSGKSVTAKSLLRLIPRPPGVIAGGKALFRSKMPCPGCRGAGCVDCGQTGRVGEPCTACAGAGCGVCGQSGRSTVDLLTIPEDELRDIRGNRIAMIFQDPGKALNPALTIRAQIAEVFAEHRSDELVSEAGLDDESGRLLRRAVRNRGRFFERRLGSLPPLRSQRRRVDAVLDGRIVEALADTRIPNPVKIMRSYPHELSGGMKQRVMIAQALACDPDLLIADEPTTALDVTIQARILDLIGELQARRGTSVLYISHDLSLVRGIADRAAVMYAGMLAEVGPAEQIFADPLHPYTRGLLAAIPTPGMGRGRLAAIEGTVPELIDPPPACRFHTRCPHAATACARTDPPLAIRQPPDHRAACLLYDDAAEVGERPEDMPDRSAAS
ncbi:MAG: ATP-binding cassette domain-containing protein [Nitriliruptorales bacterium]|nr:ATP-binding cassette domain-containing protein [Nitriliruptorales bacterium]